MLKKYQVKICDKNEKREQKFIYTLFIMLSFILNAQVSYSVGYDMNFPLEGNSIANNTLQFYVVKDIYADLSKKIPVCSDYSIKTTQLLHYPHDIVKKNNKYVHGYWKELWTVNYCGNYVQVPVNFYIGKKGTEYEIEEINL